MAAATGLILATAAGTTGILGARNKMKQMKGQETKMNNILNQKQPEKESTSIPYIDRDKIEQNKARQFSSLQRRSGRQSTLLTNSSNTFG